MQGLVGECTYDTKPNNKSQSVRTYCDRKILSQNRWGMTKQTALLCSEFQALVNGPETLCLHDTKTDDSDVIEIDGYEIKMKTGSNMVK